MELGLPAPLIRDRLKSGKVIPFLGSGSSLGERNPSMQPWNSDDLEHLPNATELAQYLAKPVEFPPDEDSKELTKTARYYEMIAGRDVLDEELHKVFARAVKYTKIHSYLASVPAPLLIISTNYDDLMERALTDQGREFDVIIHVTQATLKRASDYERVDSLLYRPHGGAPRFVTDDDLGEVDLAKTFVLYKMHGSVDLQQSERDSYVITEDDYIEFLTRMTNQSASTIPSFVIKHMSQRHLLFLGYSLRDWNLRVLLNRIDLLSRRSVSSWAVQYNPSHLEKRFWDKRNVTTFNMRVDEFVDALQKSQ